MNQIKKEINFDINNNIHINIYQYKLHMTSEVHCSTITYDL